MKRIKDINITVMAVLVGVALAAPLFFVSPAAAADSDYCRRYADTAVKANIAAQRDRCGYGGGRWHSDYKGHYNWCRGVSQDVAARETVARRNAIIFCRNSITNCRTYAQQAVAQQQENLRRSCGYRGSRWHADYNGHYNWCWANKSNIPRVQKETTQRDYALRECRARGGAGDPCTTYARNAVNHQRENKRRGCGYWGFAWHDDYNGHYRWCKGASPADVRRENDKRARELRRCR